MMHPIPKKSNINHIAAFQICFKFIQDLFIIIKIKEFFFIQTQNKEEKKRICFSCLILMQRTQTNHLSFNYDFKIKKLNPK